MVLRQTGGVLPESVKGVVRRKMGLVEGSRTPVTFADARSVKLGGKKVSFSGGFPEDLPAGEYRVAVELRDQDGKVKQRYERRLVRGKQEKNPLAGLSDAQLLDEYVKRGEVLKGSAVEPIDLPLRGRASAAFAYTSPPSLAWEMTHFEIVRRGKQIVPALVKMLETEAVRNPGEATFSTAKFGFAVDVMRMLREIGDPRPVSLLVRVMEGMDGKANLPVRWEAMETAAGLTYVTFLIERNNPATSVAMMGDGALIMSSKERLQDPNARLIRVAGLYAKWLDNEGRDPTRWLPLARERARRALEGDDPVAIRSAIAFLPNEWYSKGHDDRPEQTMQAIAKIMARSDQTVVKELQGWASLPSVLASYGPAARPYLNNMIDQGKLPPTCNILWDLDRVGGEKAVAFMVQALPQLRQKVREFGVELDVDEDHMSDMQVRDAVLTYRVCRWGIERWAGRTFRNDQEVVDWWANAKGQGQREWLEENLDRTSTEADAGSAKAQYIIRLVLPDLPHADDDDPFDPPWQRRAGMSYREKRLGPYRMQWLRENRARLEYDERQSFFTRRGK